MKRKILMMFALAVSMFCTQIIYSQENGLTMEQIVLNLQTFSRTTEIKASANRSLAKMVSQNGVNFALDKDAERILRQNFASDELILAIKKSIADKKSSTPQKGTSSKKAVAIEKPTDAEGYLARAKACTKYDYDCQIKNYDKAIEIDSQNAVAYKLRGDSHSSKNNDGQAIADYTKVIEIDPKFSDAYQSRSTVYELKGETEEAISDATKYLELKPADDYGYKRRGDLYGVYLSDYGKAVADYSKAIEINPKKYLYYENRGNNYRYANKCDLAIADYLKTIEVAETPIPAIERTYYKIGDCYGKTGQYQKAIDSYTKTIEIDSKYESAYKERAIMYEKIGDLEKAKADRKKHQELIDGLFKKD